MLWETNRKGKTFEVAPIKTRSDFLCHSFSDRQFTNNSRMNGNSFISGTSAKYSPELWHYGIKGMRWGHTTKVNASSWSYRDRAKPPITPQAPALTVDKVASNIANLQSLRNMMQQKKLKAKQNVAPAKITTQKKTPEQIRGNGAEAIKKILNEKVDLNASTDYKNAFEQFIGTELA